MKESKEIPDGWTVDNQIAGTGKLVWRSLKWSILLFAIWFTVVYWPWIKSEAIRAPVTIKRWINPDIAYPDIRKYYIAEKLDELDKVPVDQRQEGMLIYVKSEAKIYLLSADLKTWKELVLK